MTKKTSEEAVPVEETKTPTINTIKGFIRSIFIVLLSFVCVIIGVFIYQENVPVPEVKSSTIKAQNIRKEHPKRTPVILTSTKSISEPVKIEFPQSEPKAPTTINLSSENDTQPNLTATVVVEDSPTVQKNDFKVETENTPLSDLLILRDHLKNGETCLADLKKLLAQRNTHSVNESLLQDLMPVCSHPKSNFDTILETFSQEKKKALTTYYRLNNPAWLAYLKSFGARLVDIRRLDPQKQRPKDILSLAQNALNEKDITKALELTQKLPSKMKEDLNTFILEATAYTTAQKAVDDSILKFQGKGE